MDAPAAIPPVVRDAPRQTVLIELDRIDLGDRLRNVNGQTAQHIAESMKQHGLQTPIQVHRNGEGYVLISGAHRLQAARLLAWPSIEAFVLDDLDEDTLILLEIDENLVRVELSPLHRGIFVARRKKIHERLYPHVTHGGDRKSSDYQAAADGRRSFVAETASFTTFSSYTIRRAIRIGENIQPDLLEELAMTPIAYREGDLHLISGLSHEEQDALLEDIQTAEHEVQKLSDVFPRRDPGEEPPPEPDLRPPLDPPASPKTVLERVQALWFEASEGEREEISAWIELMRAQANADAHSPPS